MTAVLYVDDESPIRRAVHTWLERRGFAVYSASTVHGAKRCFHQHHIDGAFIDIWLHDGTGFDLYAWIRDYQHEVADHVVFVTGDTVSNPHTADQIEALGRPVLMKPFDLQELEQWARRWGGRDPAPGSDPPPV